MAHCYIFDLDHTLYPIDHPLGKQLVDLVHGWMAERMNTTPTSVRDQIRDYISRGEEPYKKLAEAYSFELRDVLIYPRHLNYELLKPCAETRRLISTLPAIAKLIYTDAVAEHAELALERLHLRDLFNHVYDVAFANYEGKASQMDFQHILDDYNHRHQTTITAADCTMIEDSYLNLKVAKSMGMRTILITEKYQRAQSGDWQAPDWVDELAPDLPTWLQAEHKRADS